MASAPNIALQANFPNEAKEHHINLMSDNGNQPTCQKPMKKYKNIITNHKVTNSSNPKGNANTVQMMQTIKKECP